MRCARRWASGASICCSGAIFVCGFHIAMLTVHLPAFVTDQGLRAEHGMTALALIGLFNIIGSLAAGWLGGRFSKKYLLSTIYSIRVLLISLLVFLPLSPLTLYVFACGIGLLWLGTVPLTNGLVGADLRHALRRDARLDRVLRPPDRQLRRRVAGGVPLRHDRLVLGGVPRLDRRWACSPRSSTCR